MDRHEAETDARASAAWKVDDTPRREGADTAADAERATSARAVALFLSLNGLLLGFCIVYVLTAMGLPRPAYFPLENRWDVVAGAPGIAMLYYGQLLWGVLGGAAGLGIGLLAGRLVRPPLEIYLLVVGWTGIILLLTFLFNAFQVFA